MKEWINYHFDNNYIIKKSLWTKLWDKKTLAQIIIIKERFVLQKYVFKGNGLYND